MTELDIAMASLEVAKWQAWVTAVGVAGSIIVGLVQCALILGGLRQMRKASVARDRQVDVQTKILDDRTAALTRGLEALIRGMETTILQATPARAADSVSSPAFTRGEGPHDRP